MTTHRKITIILGAGASKAYARCPYPLLPDLLPDILTKADTNTDDLPSEGGRLRLYLAYALREAYALNGPRLDNELVPARVIQQEFDRVKAVPKDLFNLPTIFQEIELVSDPTRTRAYWALAHAIGWYMCLMSKRDIDARPNSRIDKAHAKLILLIDQLLSDGVTVTVVDFNYDCVLERVRYGLGAPRFGWYYGRERKVIADTTGNTSPSSLVEAESFQTPLDERQYATWTGLIKPHGDMCTFLRGPREVYYRGLPHSHTTVAIFPQKLADIRPDDKFVRSSIMPPANSRFRHMSEFYEQEKNQLITALSESDGFIIIGWSASGTDEFYKEIFTPIFQNKSPRLYVVNRSSDGARDSDLETGLRQVFGGGAIFQDVQMCGFNETAVERLEQLFSTDDNSVTETVRTNA